MRDAFMAVTSESEQSWVKAVSVPTRNDMGMVRTKKLGMMYAKSLAVEDTVAPLETTSSASLNILCRNNTRVSAAMLRKNGVRISRKMYRSNMRILNMAIS
jgi:hypothetical protein